MTVALLLILHGLRQKCKNVVLFHEDAGKSGLRNSMLLCSMGLVDSSLVGLFNELHLFLRWPFSLLSLPSPILNNLIRTYVFLFKDSQGVARPKQNQSHVLDSYCIKLLSVLLFEKFCFDSLNISFFRFGVKQKIIFLL